MKTKITIGVVVAVLLILGLIFSRSGETVVERIVGASSGPDHYNLEQFLGGFLRGNVNATSTSSNGTTVTLRASDLVGYDTILFTPNNGATTITFPASSSLASLVPKAGNVQETCFYNATSTSAATITFTFGTGVDWESVASSTGTYQAPAAIPAGGFGCFKFIRKPLSASAFDIGAVYTQFVNSD